MSSVKAAGSLKFTHDVSKCQAIFLYLEIFKGERHQVHNMLDTRPYLKPKNKFLYLPALRNHPSHMKLGIVRGESIRCLQNSTNKADWLLALHKIFKALIARGYIGADIQRAWRKIRWEDRDSSLFAEAGGGRQKPEGTLVMTTFHPRTKQVWRLMIAKHSLKRRVRPRGRHFPAPQRDIIDHWPPHIIFRDFPKLGRFLIAAQERVSKE